MRVALVSFSRPVGFGPYPAQFRLLARALCVQHFVLWVALTADTGGQLVTNLPAVDAERWLPANVSYLGGSTEQGQPVYVSEINQLLRPHRIDALITLCDLTRFFVDERLEPRAVAWFPNHFASLDVHSMHALHAFDAIASLAPTDAKRIEAQLPYKEVRLVPHAIADAPPEHTSREGKLALRTKHGLPPSAFIVAVTFANYDGQNRKNIDISALAFRELQAALAAAGDADGGGGGGGRRAFLYVRAIVPEEMQAHIRAGIVQPLDVVQILRVAGISAEDYRVDTHALPHGESLELIAVADVLLMPSKTEGFGAL